MYFYKDTAKTMLSSGKILDFLEFENTGHTLLCLNPNILSSYVIDIQSFLKRASDFELISDNSH